LTTYKIFYSEIIPNSLKNNPSSQPQLFSPEPEVAVLVDNEAVSVEDEASVNEAAAESDK
jgi:hypothetical protein